MRRILMRKLFQQVEMLRIRVANLEANAAPAGVQVQILKSVVRDGLAEAPKAATKPAGKRGRKA